MYRIGQSVMLIGTDGFMPPFGAVGEIHTPLDRMGDYDVLFWRYPCPVAEPYWVAHHSWLMPINRLKEGDTSMSCEKHGYTNGVFCPACDAEEVALHIRNHSPERVDDVKSLGAVGRSHEDWLTAKCRDAPAQIFRPHIKAF